MRQTASRPGACGHDHHSDDDDSGKDIEYQNSAFQTCNSGVKHDNVNCSGPPRNVVLVGTKLDIVMRDESKRQVKFKDALALATRLNLAGVVETSAKESNKTVGMMEDINDCFMITATSCFDFLNRQKLMNNVLAQ